MAAAARSTEVLVVGASGLLGASLMAELASAGIDAAGTFLARAGPGLLALDLGDRESVGRTLDELRPRVVINTAAESNVDLCEREPERSYRSNVEAVATLARACHEAGSRLLTFSSDYVFGDGEGPHEDGESPVPLNVYGQHKLEAEGRAAELAADHLVIRVCNLYGYQAGGKNFVMGLIERLSQGRPVQAPHDQWGSPTLASDLARAVLLVARSELCGTVHMAGPENLDRLSFARRTALALGFDSSAVEGIATAELSQAARRPLRGGLLSSPSVAELGVRLCGIDGGLVRVRADMEAALAAGD